jgi:hypothetical protein
MRHGFTGSRAPLWHQCMYWARTDVYGTLPKQEGSGEARLGSAFHELAEGEGEDDDEHEPSSEDRTDAIEELLDNALDDLWAKGASRLSEVCHRWGLSPEQASSLRHRFELFQTWWKNFHPHLEWQHEIPFAYDTRIGSARRILSKEHRDYRDCKPTEIPMTLDAIAYDPKRRLVIVVDFKTGRDADPAHRSFQLKLGALCCSLVYHVSHAEVLMVKVSDTAVDATTARLDSIDVQGYEDQLVERFRHMPMAEPEPGPHCSKLRCPARSVCPAGRDAIVQLAPAAARKYPLIGPIMGPEHAQYLLGIRAMVPAFMKEVMVRIKAEVDRVGKVVLPDGSILEMRKTVSKSIKPSKELVKFVADKHGVDLVPYMTLSKRGVESAMRTTTFDRSELDERINAVFKWAEEHQLVTERTTTKYGPHRPRGKQK